MRHVDAGAGARVFTETCPNLRASDIMLIMTDTNHVGLVEFLATVAGKSG